MAAEPVFGGIRNNAKTNNRPTWLIRFIVALPRRQGARSTRHPSKGTTSFEPLLPVMGFRWRPDGCAQVIYDPAGVEAPRKETAGSGEALWRFEREGSFNREQCSPDFCLQARCRR